MPTIAEFFEVRERGSTVAREVVGGLTTFFTMSYIVFVQPAVLSLAGMPFGSVLLATCISSAFGCFLMGVIARYPFALAPGMGANFLFAFTLCGAMQFSWPAGLAVVFVAGALFLVLSLWGVREKVMEVLPDCLKNAIGPAIGLFIAFIGLQWSGIIVLDPATMVSLAGFHSATPLVSALAVLLIVVLLARSVPGAILIGILAAAGGGLLAGYLQWPQEALRLSFETFGHLDFGELFSRWPEALLAIALFFFLDLFDTIGTLVGVSTQAGLLTKEGKLPRAPQAFFSDAAATCAGALCGTSTVTTYIESATGVAAGARTGLASIVTGLCFLAAPLLGPVVRIAGQDTAPQYYAQLGIENAAVSMYPAAAPAMIVVGMLMIAPLARVKWDDVTEAFPAFLTVAMMAFGFGITEGVAAGCIAYAVTKPLAGRPREVHPALYVIALALILRYALLV